MSRLLLLAALCSTVALTLLLQPPRATRASISRAPAQAVVRVTITNFSFRPRTITVAPGTRVVWTNKDGEVHTVTNDRNAWSSEALDTDDQYAHVFTARGTYTYHCSIHPFMTGTIVVGRSAGGASAAPPADSPPMATGAMGAMGMASMMTWTGYYDDHAVHYLSTDTSSRAEARSEHINYAPNLATSLRYTQPIYLVTNGAFATHGAVFGSQPGESDYTPLWHEVKVTWRVPGAAVALGSDNQIAQLVKAGKVTLTSTDVVLNCPIITPSSGG
jgi:plastocyanin